MGNQHFRVLFTASPPNSPATMGTRSSEDRDRNVLNRWKYTVWVAIHTHSRAVLHSNTLRPVRGRTAPHHRPSSRAMGTVNSAVYMTPFIGITRKQYSFRNSS